MQRAVDHMCDIHQSPSVVLDDDKHCRDEVDVQQLMETLLQHMINPFATDGLQFVHVATRRLVLPEVCKATLATVALGTEQLNQFIQEHLMTNEKELSKPIRRNKLATSRTF